MNNYKKYNIIWKLINTTYPNECNNNNIEYIGIKNNIMYLSIKNKYNLTFLITIADDDTWKEINFILEKRLNKKNLDNCDLCLFKIKKNISCNKCSNSFCLECYIKLYTIGKGIITCPWCRYKIGYELPEYLIKKRIEELRKNFI